MMKKTVALKMEIRKLLTEEQRIMFDSHSQKHGKTSHAGKGYQGHF